MLPQKSLKETAFNGFNLVHNFVIRLLHEQHNLLGLGVSVGVC